MAGRGPSDIRPRPVGQGGAIGIARRVQVPVACAQGRYTGRKPISTKFVAFRPEKRSFPDLAISGTGWQLHRPPRCLGMAALLRSLVVASTLCHSHQQAEPSVAEPTTARGPLDAVRDFGAVPDGRVVDAATGQVGGTDNSAALQQAIDAAQLQGRSLFLPEGRYMVNTTLLVGCATPATACPGCLPTGDAGACVEPNATAGKGPTAGKWGLYPLILAGAGRALTTIAAQGNMHAILQFTGPPGGGTIGKSSILHDLKDLAFDAGGVHAMFPLLCPLSTCNVHHSNTIVRRRRWCPGLPALHVPQCPAAYLSGSQHQHLCALDHPLLLHADQLLQRPARRHVARV